MIRRSGRIVYCRHEDVRWAEAEHEPCPGMLLVDPDTEHDESWITDCDACGIELGVTPEQKSSWLQRHGQEQTRSEASGGTGGGAASGEQGSLALGSAPAALPEVARSTSALRRLRRRRGGGDYH